MSDSKTLKSDSKKGKSAQTIAIGLAKRSGGYINTRKEFDYQAKEICKVLEDLKVVAALGLLRRVETFILAGCEVKKEFLTYPSLVEPPVVLRKSGLLRQE